MRFFHYRMSNRENQVECVCGVEANKALWYDEKTESYFAEKRECKVKIPAFGESVCFEDRENAAAKVWVKQNVKEEGFDACCAWFAEEGYIKKEEYCQGAHRFAAFEKESCGIFVNYHGNVQELTIVQEEECLYFAYEDAAPKVSVPAQITQIALEDFGMSYAIRLPDGRFIVLDGGREFEPDQDRLLACLKEGAMGNKPVIAAWIMTHPHPDHFHCFIGFMDRYADEVHIEKFLLNFPEPDDLEHYPSLAYKDPRFEDSSPRTNIPLMFAHMRRTDAPIYMVHTGQRYRIGQAECQVLACMDDTLYCSQNINAGSAMLRMELAGQVILWAADASFSIARIPEKYGAFLKADILQVPHHGFQSGTAEAEICGYDWIRPRVCFLPVSDYNAYTVFCTYKQSTRYLMRDSGVEEIITGTRQRTITLPYTPPPFAKRDLERQYLNGLDNAGACAWVYSDLCTAEPQDFQFTLLNMCNTRATVWIELFFESSAQRVRSIKAEIAPESLKRINIVGEDVDGDALHFTWLTLMEQGVPENALFAVRFLCDVPIVVSHKTHEPSYRSSVNR